MAMTGMVGTGDPGSRLGFSGNIMALFIQVHDGDGTAMISELRAQTMSTNTSPIGILKRSTWRLAKPDIAFGSTTQKVKLLLVGQTSIVQA